MKLPNKYDTLVGYNGINLSGGEKQRIALARIFLKNPKILLLDEATSALDAINEQQVLHSICKNFQNSTIMLISHHITNITKANNIIVMEKNNLLKGSHEFLLNNSDFYSDLYKSNNL